MKKVRITFVLSLILSLLVIVANLPGLLLPERLYAKETDSWCAQAWGQDLFNLVVAVPVLIISSILVYRQNKKAIPVWAGVLAYLVYTFVIYSFSVHFNRLFIVYCLVLGLSVYLFSWFLLSQYKSPARIQVGKNISIGSYSLYMIITGSAFYMLWLAQIIPANINNQVPRELVESGLPVNPVHVLDLSVCLPGIIATGILLLKRRPLALLLTPVVLTLFVLMDLTIGSLMIVMQYRGLEPNPILMITMFALAALSLGMLIYYLRSIKLEG